jgi:hypothetical protein
MIGARWMSALWIALLGVVLATPTTAQSADDAVRGQGRRAERLEYGPAEALSQILGRPTDHSIALSVLSSADIEAYVEFGIKQGEYTRKTPTASSKAGAPFEIEIDGLPPNTRHFYRLRSRQRGQAEFDAGPECAFQTQRPPGDAFTFALQGDSHPERLGRMYHPDLYARTMRNVEKDQPDFYLTLGDDFSLDRHVNRDTLSQSNVDQVYAHQRSFLGLVGRSSPLFLVNGNHEQAAQEWLDGTPANPAVLAGKSRVRFYPLPAPDAFYRGNSEQTEFVGLLRDYYSWTWGDALFVVIDPYWHSPASVDSAAGSEKRRGGSGAGGRPDESGVGRRPDGSDDSRRVGRSGGGGRRGESGADRRLDGSDGGERGGRTGGGGRRGGSGGGRQRDWWGMSIGDTQYEWLKMTLTQSKARHKFVFAHHVMGTGRGGIEMADLYEWGGKNPDGTWGFDQKRPGWEKPIHQLMVKTGVTIFFQGHDHIFCRQELDGVVYQSTPNPADSTYQAFNSEAYRSGDILPNSGHLRVTVSPEHVRVDYVSSFLPEDESDGRKNGEIAFSYTIAPTPKTPR